MLEVELKLCGIIFTSVPCTLFVFVLFYTVIFTFLCQQTLKENPDPEIQKKVLEALQKLAGKSDAVRHALLCVFWFLLLHGGADHG